MKISSMIFLVPDTQLSSPCFTMQDLTSISEKNILVYTVSPDTATKVLHLVLPQTDVKLLFCCSSKFVNIFKCPVFQILRCLITTVKHSHLLDTLLGAPSNYEYHQCSICIPQFIQWRLDNGIKPTRRALSSGSFLSHVLTHARQLTIIKLSVALKLPILPNGPRPYPAQCPRGPEGHPRAIGNAALEPLSAVPPRFPAAGGSTTHANALEMAFGS